MTKLELLTFMYALRALLKKGLYEDAEELVNNVIREAEK